VQPVHVSGQLISRPANVLKAPVEAAPATHFTFYAAPGVQSVRWASVNGVSSNKVGRPDTWASQSYSARTGPGKHL